MTIPTGAGPQPPRGGIVVGVDGSPGSLAALRWAIREASARGRAVHAVTAWEVPTESTFGDLATVGDFHPVIAAERILVAALADAGAADSHRHRDHRARPGAPRRGADAAGRARRTAGGRLPRAREDLRGAARLGQPVPGRATPPARSSSSNPSPISTVEDPVRDADAPAPTVRIPYACTSQYDRSERTDGRGHVSGGDA